MDIQHLSAFVATSVILMFIPGVDMALVTRQVVMYGRRAAFGTLGGLLVGGLTHAALATTGLSAVLLTSATAYTAVKTIGAIYLVALGVQAIWASWRHRRATALEEAGSRPGQQSTMRLPHAFLLGLISDVTNPKVAIFFLSFLPQFVVPGQDASSQIAFLGVLFNAIATTWWVCYVLLLDHVTRWLRRSAVRRAVENLTGAVLVALGIRVAIERR